MAHATSAPFREWLKNLNDHEAEARIHVRLTRLRAGNPGDVKSVGGGVSELRIDYGPGYRVYFMSSSTELILLLCGGDKTTQAADIECAYRYRDDYLQRMKEAKEVKS
ncbi:MAG TPA: type II toxin-antitoxin system RelE/ParE family toxin [Blastocatellia bacterium]|nr:type II toxin-antitoxin system RelE/ParE family toxin [Blastocatellia bacterium]